MSPLMYNFEGVVTVRIVGIADGLQAFCFDPFISCSETQLVDLDRK